MSWTPADISVEIDAMTRLLQARPGVIDLEDKLCNSLRNKLKSILNIEASALVQIYDTARSANLPDRIRQEILSTLDGMAVGEVLEWLLLHKIARLSTSTSLPRTSLRFRMLLCGKDATFWLPDCDCWGSKA